jgi:transcriptional/translational regulatory protein YebC/TACO1
VGYLFEQKGLIVAIGDEETVMLAALDGGAEDVTGSGDQWEVVSAPGDLSRVRASLEKGGITVESAEVTQLPTTTVALDEPNARKVLRLLDALEDLDDVQEVFANFDIPDEVLESVG